MSNIEITIKLPEELLERAQAIGLNIPDGITQVVEDEISRREVAQYFIDNEAQLDAMAADPDIQREINRNFHE